MIFGLIIEVQEEVNIMLDVVKEEMLQVYEQSEECKELRDRVIDETFEKNVNDYILACNVVNEIADEYFFAGLKAGLN